MKNLVNDPMKSQETGITERIGIKETVTEPETKIGTKNVIVIVTVHVIVTEVGIAVVIMIEIEIMDVLVIGTVRGTMTMKLVKQTMIVGIHVIRIMIMSMGKQNMIVEDMVKENEVMIMVELMRIGGGMRVIMGTSILKLSMMTITGIIRAEDIMMIKVLWMTMIVIIIMLVKVAIWKNRSTVMIRKPEEAEESS